MTAEPLDVNDEADVPGLPVGIVVVTYSPGASLATFLDSVQGAVQSAVGGLPQIVLADNGTTDGSVELAADRTRVRLIRTGGNLGYGTAANIGAAAFGPEVRFVLVANPDLVLGPGSIDALLAAAVRHPEAGAFGPSIRTPEGDRYPSARRLPSIGGGVGHAALGWVWPRNPWTRRYRQEEAVVGERAAGWLSGACVMVRRAAFDQLGGFDERYFMYFEDVDLGDRLGRAGFVNLYVPTAEVIHIGGETTSRAPREMVEAHHRSAYRYLADRHPAWWQAPLRWTMAIGLGLRWWLANRSSRVSAGARIAADRG